MYFKFMRLSALESCNILHGFWGSFRNTHTSLTRSQSSRMSTYKDEIYANAAKIYSAAIDAVSPVTLVTRALQFDRSTRVLSIDNHTYHLKKNVKVVAFGKAVLGMVTAVEGILGDHIIEGVASVPMCAVKTAMENLPHHIPPKSSKITIREGAPQNLPDAAAESTARQILKLVENAKEDELIIALVSGGGSALLPCPVDSITIEEKRQVMESLAKQGANIQELNTFRKALSQTKGGKLARAAYPSKLLALILSDVIGDPLDVIASGPTVPNLSRHSDVISILHKYKLIDKVPKSVTLYLQKLDVENDRETEQRCIPISNGQYSHTQNVLIGTNRIATEAALSVANGIGYSTCVWSHTIEGEARLLGEEFASLAYSFLLEMDRRAEAPHHPQGKCPNLCEDNLPKIDEGFVELFSTFQKLVQQSSRPYCLISGGEPTVTVRGGGKGGRNQEMALAFAAKLHELNHSNTRASRCVFVSVGTDGQDGPCDAAGAIVDSDVVNLAQLEGLDPQTFLDNNDSYTFFSRLNGGQHLIKTGLTGTNVMDVHILLLF